MRIIEIDVRTLATLQVLIKELGLSKTLSSTMGLGPDEVPRVTVSNRRNGMRVVLELSGSWSK